MSADRTGRGPSGVVLCVAAALVLVGGYVHFFLYVHGGYRGIRPESLLGLTIARAFVLDAVASVVVAEFLVVATRIRALTPYAVVAAIGHAAATLGAYGLSRTVGLLGFTERATTAEGVLAGVAEVALLALLVPVALRYAGTFGSQSARRASKDVISAS